MEYWGVLVYMNKRNNKARIKKILSVVILLVICVGGFHIIKLYLPHNYGTTTGNFMNRQWFVDLSGEVYFFGKSDDEEGIFKIDREGKIHKISEQTGANLNGVGDYLYFCKWNEIGEKDQIVKIKKDGSESQILLEGEIGLELIVVDNTIYFSYTPENEKFESIYRMNTEGKFLKKTELSQGVFLQLLLNPQMHITEFGGTGGYVSGSIQIKDKYIYYYIKPELGDSKYYDLYRTKGEVEEGEFLADRVTAFNVAEDNYLYYAQLNEDSVTISKMNMETKEHEQLVEIITDGEQVLILNVAANKMYIGVERKESYLINTDGTGLTKVSDLLNQ